MPPAAYQRLDANPTIHMQMSFSGSTMPSEAGRFGSRWWAIQDEQLALDQNGLSYHGARPAGPSNRAIFAMMWMKRGAGSRMAEHGDKIAKCTNLPKLTIRQGHLAALPNVRKRRPNRKIT
jgi:hypothetical protein